MGIPLTVLSVSWPQPVQEKALTWISDPVWEAPLMTELPKWKLHLIDDIPLWCLDWRDFFRAGLKCQHICHGGEMRGFHVIFRLIVHLSGDLHFWDDDGSIIRRRGEIVHQDRSAHPLMHHTLSVKAGDEIVVAQWQLQGDWLWCARIEEPGAAPPLRSYDYLGPYLPFVRKQLAHPNGPPLKMYTAGHAPIRAIACIYSLVLNGYTPSQVLLFGDEQWSERTHHLFARFLPFARTVLQSEALAGIEQYGGPELAQRARECWFVMKAFVALALPPAESCLMDDDVFVLDRLDDALAAFACCELVYMPDQDLTIGYARAWARHFGFRLPLKTSRFNAGLYWIRNQPESSRIQRAALRTPSNAGTAIDWEQGLIAFSYSDRPTHELASQRYFYALFDGLPGGILGYDYRSNPCGFSSIHYGGLGEKPSEAAVIQLLPDILSRGCNLTEGNEAAL